MWYSWGQSREQYESSNTLKLGYNWRGENLSIFFNFELFRRVSVINYLALYAKYSRVIFASVWCWSILEEGFLCWDSFRVCIISRTTGCGLCDILAQTQIVFFFLFMVKKQGQRHKWKQDQCTSHFLWSPQSSGLKSLLLLINDLPAVCTNFMAFMFAEPLCLTFLLENQEARQ